MSCWFYIAPGATHEVEHARLTVAERAALTREAPPDRGPPGEPKAVGERLGELEIATASDPSAVDDLGTHLLPLVGDDEVDAAGQHRVSDPDAAGVELRPARRLRCVGTCRSDPDDGGLPSDNRRRAGGARLFAAL